MVTLYVSTSSGFLGRRGEALVFSRRGGDKTVIPSVEVEDVVVVGNGTVSTAALQLLMERQVPVHYLSTGGRYLGGSLSARGGASSLRRAQYRAAEEVEPGLRIARGVVTGKLLNQRALLRRFVYRHEGETDEISTVIRELEKISRWAAVSTDMEQLRGIEGHGAALYFSVFGRMLRPPWRFTGRNRRPPRDPVNALLSFGYTLLLVHATTAAALSGLDPCVGFLHPEHRGRPSVALDLMEPFRPVVVDRLLLALINQGMFSPEDFSSGGDDGGVRMAVEARRRYVVAFEQRLTTRSTTPEGQGGTYLLHLRYAARRMAQALVEETPYMPFVAPV